jgi:hypothetical protein
VDRNFSKTLGMKGCGFAVYTGFDRKVRGCLLQGSGEGVQAIHAGPIVQGVMLTPLGPEREEGSSQSGGAMKDPRSYCSATSFIYAAWNGKALNWESHIRGTALQKRGRISVQLQGYGVRPLSLVPTELLVSPNQISAECLQILPAFVGLRCTLAPKGTVANGSFVGKAAIPYENEPSRLGFGSSHFIAIVSAAGCRVRG